MGAGVDGLRAERATHSEPPSTTTRVASVTVPEALSASKAAMATGPEAWFWAST